MKRIIVAVTGASGAIYGRSTLLALARSDWHIELVVSSAGQRVAHEELQCHYEAATLTEWLGERAAQVTQHPVTDIGARIASGSFPVSAMLVSPCSMGTVGRIAAGLSQNLIERAADVQLKERRPLVLVIRESPLSTIHLQNLLRLSQAGATIVPAAPGFYSRPESVDELVRFVVERSLQAANLSFDRQICWQGKVQ